jgi:putative transcriptional regulator
VNNRLRELRAEHGMSQAELGGRVGVSRQAINLIENRRHDPSLSLAYSIGRVFGLPVEAIFMEGKDEESR